MSSDSPTVSVLMPVYNGERWLPQALESALAQTFADFEVLVVDDGSTDRSREIVEEFAARDPRVRLVRAEHGGLTRTREISLPEARGRYVAFLDVDDEWVPHKLERQLPHADDRTVVFSDFWYLLDGDTEVGPRLTEVASLPSLEYPAAGLYPHLLARGCFIQISSVLAPRQLLIDAGAFRGFPGCEDYEMWLRLSLRGARFAFVEEPLMVYRQRPDSLSADVLWVLQKNLVMAENLLPDVRDEDRRLLRRARRHWRQMIGNERRRRAWLEVRYDSAGVARRELIASLRSRPTSLRSWVVLALTLSPPLARRLRSSTVSRTSPSG